MNRAKTSGPSKNPERKLKKKYNPVYSTKDAFIQPLLKKKISKTVIIIAGPTAVGKTAVAVTMARHYSTAIISADSRQCFREMSAGVARPSIDELNSVPHYFVASHSIHDEMTAAIFEQYALEKAAMLFASHDIVIMTGGTGLYIRAFAEGLDTVPATDPGTRKKFQDLYLAKGIAGLQEEIRTKDPLFYEKGEIQNPQRLMRALEVIELSGRSLLSFKTHQPRERDFNIIKIGLELPREILRDRIAKRVKQMMDEGLLAEVKSLLPFRQLNALNTVGYTELFDYLDGKIPLDKAITQIIHHTRQYAKRQMTWFRKDKDIYWFNPESTDEIKVWLDQQLISLSE